MNAFWHRLKYTVQEDLNSLMDKPRKKENPLALLNQYFLDAQQQTTEIGKLLERQGRLKEELENERQDAELLAMKRRDQLKLAEAAGEYELVSFAKEEVEAYENRVARLSASIQDATQELLSLERKFEEMKHRIKDMRVRQLQLMGKENVTRAQEKMDKFVQPDPIFSTLDDLHSYIENLGSATTARQSHSSMEQRLDSLEKSAKSQDIV
ncbi:PspA/IM30 family protein [Sporosarcina sp. PTS2304]|uniref:PspA/IM30 family protein n=1 Tax=Sporosarcina sp. PTS2304 TaxID=2283194 RepID=UPI000E0DBE67|nr:PspA/IM30 family protein [Sporosarcina sp. PTS2304]AXI00869.1 PspA/IM30 family protein [Sporosarcina sp. PTS2304]